MKELAVGLWQRANTALTVANAVLSLDPDTAASRAYIPWRLPVPENSGNSNAVAALFTSPA